MKLLATALRVTEARYKSNSVLCRDRSARKCQLKGFMHNSHRPVFNASNSRFAVFGVVHVYLDAPEGRTLGFCDATPAFGWVIKSTCRKGHFEEKGFTPTEY
ncbi:hypothetical protein NPIL_611181 [Nephila pilipes]|uniref:Uncharacterized protein n=1 Tax=Nephila pilipes TaxID=299642 RepID=A0A8X6Q742_NEPPI|nr:hypothetical protein NPIL_611181 [Nephila pilipes]